jgi:hypothetical protein
MELFANDIKLPFDKTLQIRFYNPMFNETAGYSFPVKLNNKIPAVKKAFGFTGSTNIDSPQSVAASIKTKFLDLQGKWQITESSADRIETYFKPGSGDFISLINKKTLRDLEYGGVKYPVGINGSAEDVFAHMDTKMNAVYPTYEYAAFCAYMPKAYGDETALSFQLVNERENAEGVTPHFKVTETNQANNTVYLFVGTVIEYLFGEHGYRIGKNSFSGNADLQRLVIFNTYNRKASTAFDYTKLVPNILCTDFIKAIRNRFNIGFFINERSKVVDIVLFDDILQFGAKTLGTKFTSKPVITGSRSTGLNFPLNAPDTWSKHSSAGAGDFYPQTPIVVNKFADIIPGAGTLYNVYFVKSEAAYYRVVYEESIYSAKRICTNNFPYNEGTNGTEIPQFSGIPGMFTYVETWVYETEIWDPEGQTWLPQTYTNYEHMVMPRCDLECTDNVSSNIEFPLMFLFTRGIQNSYVVPGDWAPTGIQYPLGTSDIYDAEGNEISGADLTLNWGGADGIIAAFWANRLNWELNIKKIVKGDLTGDDIHELIDFSQIVRIENNNYIVNSIELEISNTRVKITDAELFRV